MPTIDDHSSASVVKALLVGDSGSGKTTALATLANAGYELFICDCDNGLDTLRHFVKPEHHKRVHFKTFIDKTANVQGMLKGLPQAAQGVVGALVDWTEPAPPGYAPPALVEAPKPAGPFGAFAPPTAPTPSGPPTISLGNPNTWGPHQVLVIDSLTFFGNACMNFAQGIAGKLGQQPSQADWGNAIRMQENLLTMLYSDDIKCQVIVTAHLAFQEDKSIGGVQRGYPSALGNKLPARVSRYFNSVILMESTVPIAAGQPVRRVIRTRSTPRIELKTPVPTMPDPLDCDPFSVTPSGLARFIEIVRGSPLTLPQ